MSDLSDLTVKPYEVYLIRAPGYWYVGSTTRGYEKRFQEHMRFSSSYSMRTAVNKLGADAFTVKLLQQGTGTDDVRTYLEQAHLDRHLLAWGISECLNVARPCSHHFMRYQAEMRFRAGEEQALADHYEALDLCRDLEALHVGAYLDDVFLRLNLWEPEAIWA
jgi:hypothetical protein